MDTSEAGAELLADPSVDVLPLLGYRDDVPLPPDRRLASLRNVGNTCYLNALLHALAAIPRVALWACSHEREARARPRHNGDQCPLCLFAKDIRHIRSAERAENYVPRIVAARGTWTRERGARRGIFDNQKHFAVNKRFRFWEIAWTKWIEKPYSFKRLRLRTKIMVRTALGIPRHSITFLVV